MMRLRATGMLGLLAILVVGAGCDCCRPHQAYADTFSPSQQPGTSGATPNASSSAAQKPVDPWANEVHKVEAQPAPVPGARGQMPDPPAPPPMPPSSVVVPPSPPAGPPGSVTLPHAPPTVNTPPSPPGSGGAPGIVLPPSPPEVAASSIGGATGDLVSLRVHICAWVNGKPLLEGELEHMAAAELDRIKNLAEPDRSAQRKKILEANLKGLINQEVVYQDALHKLEKNEVFLDKLKTEARKQFNKMALKERLAKQMNDVQFKKFLEMSGTSLEDQYHRFERKFIVDEYVRFRILPILDRVGCHQDVVDYYEAHKNEFQSPDRVEWEDIFLQVGTQRMPTLDYARQWAQYLVGQLSEGVPIADLMKYDDGDSSTRKGRGFGERRGEIKPTEIEAYLFTMKPGQVGPPVELATGIHVFRLVRREYASQMPFTPEVQTRIRNKLKNQVFQQEFDRIVSQLKSQTVIDVDPGIFK